MEFMSELECRQRKDNPKSWYSLEPGGQIEWASPPERTLFDIQQCLDRHLIRVTDIRNHQGLMVLDYSLDPLYHPQDIDLIHQHKYEIMHARFLETGSRGMWMMRNSTSVQINLDYTSIEEASEMAFLADALSPFTAVLFANSPFAGGRPSGTDNLRLIVWNRTDPARCGTLWSHGIRNPEHMVDQFSTWAATVPLIFIPDDAESWQPSNQPGGEWLNSLSSFEDRTSAVPILLHQIFSHIRFKNVLEIRGIDRPPFGYELAAPAWWLGLLTDEGLRRDLLDRVSRWTDEERQALELNALTVDWSQIGPEKKSFETWIRELADLALAGLAHRRQETGQDETVFLRPFLEVALDRGPFSLTRQADYAQSGLSLPRYIEEQFKEKDLIHDTETRA